MRSLRRQLTIGLVASFAGLLAVGGTLLIWAVRDSLHDQFDAALRVKALIVITETRVAGQRIRVSFSDRFLREFDDDVATEFFQVFDGEGRSIERSDSLHQADLPLRAGSLTEPEYWNLALPNGEPGRAIGIRFQAPHDRRDREARPLDASVVVASSRRELDRTVAELRNILAGGALSLLAVTALTVPLVLRRGLRPLNRMAELAQRIDAMSLQTRFPVAPLPRELSVITRRLNDLLARLEASFERERRFSADLAHELRTPLAELRAQAELMLKWPEERTAAGDQAVLDIALHLERLVTRLLALVRAEHGQQEVQRTEFDLATLVHDVLRTLARPIGERGLMVATDGVSPLVITTDRVLLQSIVSNLIENAVTYAPAGSRVAIGATSRDGAFRLEVCNLAPDLSADDLPQMFHRLWRGDRARAGGEHLGLGLALSRSFAELLGLQLAAHKQGDTLVMTVSGPQPRRGGAQCQVPSARE